MSPERCLGAMYAVRFALNSGFTVIEIRYDYEGIEKWVTGAWKSKNDLTKKICTDHLGWGTEDSDPLYQSTGSFEGKIQRVGQMRPQSWSVANGNGIPKVKSLSDFEAADGVEA